MNMSSAIAFSAVAGYVFHEGRFDFGAVWVFTGVLMLACAATVLNQYQERKQDALMQRTRNRPIPMGLITPVQSLLIALVSGVAGTIVLYLLTNPLTALLGLFNIFWYNAVYTPLKKRTPFVVIVGAVTGAVPPVMGWTAAGGLLIDKEILFIAAFLFLWQIPHFLLLLLKYKDDYDKAGFKSATISLNDEQVKSVVFIWTLGTALITLFFPLFGIISGGLLTAAIITANILLIVFFFRETFNRQISFNIGKAFGSLYLYQIVVLVILIIDRMRV